MSQCSYTIGTWSGERSQKCNINKNPDIKQNKLLSTMIFYYFISRDGIAHGTRGEVMRCRVNIWEANTINVMIIIIVIVLFYIIFSTCTHMHCTEMRIICVWVIECSCWYFSCIFWNIFYCFPFFKL